MKRHGNLPLGREMHKAAFLQSNAADLFAAFFENSNVGMAILDRQLRYKTVNHYLATVHGLSIQAHLGRHVHEMLGSLTAPVEAALRSVLDSKRPVCGVELIGNIPRSAAHWHWIVNYFPITEPDGTVKELGAVVLEVPKHARPLLPAKAASPRTVLRSWKEIADYLGACTKTVQRWEHTLAFPVRRLNPNKGATVFALASEVDAWLDRTSRFTGGENLVLAPRNPGRRWL